MIAVMEEWETSSVASSVCSSDEEDEPEAQVSCLMGLLDLQAQATKFGCRLTRDTYTFIIRQMLTKLGLFHSKKLITKLVKDGIIKWEDECEVESILDIYYDEEPKETFYLVKWLGWSQEHNIWLPKSNLNCTDLLEEFHDLNDTEIPGKKRRRLMPVTQTPQDPQEKKEELIDELCEKLIESGAVEKVSLIDLVKDLVKDHSPMKRRANSNCLIVDKASKKREIKKAPRRGKSYKLKKQEVAQALKDWESHMNNLRQGHDPAPISVENTVDLEGPPSKFIYINKRKPTENVDISDDPLIGCECENCYDCRKTCCPISSNSQIAYRQGTKRLKVPRGVPIYECNSRCKCGPDCVNRVVQHGRQIKVCIFRTPTRGWGVKTLQKIKKGSFVMEYVGEIITNEEAELRGKDYDACGITYLFDLDFHDSEGPFSVDAGVYGNASHFINHSCDPNLEVHVVWINCLDPRFPHICLFAKRDIAKNEELSFDYLSGQLQRADDSFSEKMDSVDEVDGAAPCIVNKEDPLTVIPDIPIAATSDNTEHIFKLPLQPILDTPIFSNKDNIKLITSGIEEAESKENKSPNQEIIFTSIKDLPTPPVSDTESVSGSTSGSQPVSRFHMACLCGTKICRKFLFF